MFIEVTLTKGKKSHLVNTMQITDIQQRVGSTMILTTNAEYPHISVMETYSHIRLLLKDANLIVNTGGKYE